MKPVLRPVPPLSGMASLAALQDSPAASRIIIVGAGIVGSALAYYLSESSTSQIVLVESFAAHHLGSTGLAPGLVGQLNESKVLTELAKETVKEYQSIPKAFDSVGGLEIYQTTSSSALQERRQLAHDAGLRASIVDSKEAARLAPDLVDPSQTKAALHFPDDGTANAGVITTFYRDKARDRGVEFLEADCDGLNVRNGKLVGIKTPGGNLSADYVVVAVGIWTSRFLKNITTSPLPVVSVAHPYCFAEERPRREYSSPFVRWPESHVYARDHGTCDGFGTYEHVPTVMDPGSSAMGEWLPGVFKEALLGAETILQPKQSKVVSQFNGLFAVTPDNLPMAGRLQEVPNVFLCSAVWVTHAAAVARFVSKLLLGKDVDEEMVQALDPSRFAGRNPSKLQAAALRRYNDIYNSQPLKGA